MKLKIFVLLLVSFVFARINSTLATKPPKKAGNEMVHQSNDDIKADVSFDFSGKIQSDYVHCNVTDNNSIMLKYIAHSKDAIVVSHYYTKQITYQNNNLNRILYQYDTYTFSYNNPGTLYNRRYIIKRC